METADKKVMLTKRNAEKLLERDKALLELKAIYFENGNNLVLFFCHIFCIVVFPQRKRKETYLFYFLYK